MAISLYRSGVVDKVWFTLSLQLFPCTVLVWNPTLSKPPESQSAVLPINVLHTIDDGASIEIVCDNSYDVVVKPSKVQFSCRKL